MKFEVIINGTEVNPYHEYGLTMNPFPKLEPQLLKHDQVLRLLEAIPVRDKVDLKNRLEGLFSDAFVQLCLDKYEQGKVVRFTVTFSDNLLR